MKIYYTPQETYYKQETGNRILHGSVQIEVEIAICK
jgi:hypothetical protein